MRQLFLVVVVVVASSCGTVDGFPCETKDSSQCDGADVTFCETAPSGGLKWKTYACPMGCDVVTGRCAWAGVKAGDACPPSEQTSICTADGEIAFCQASEGGSRWVPAPCSRCVKGQPPATVLRKDGDAYVCD